MPSLSSVLACASLARAVVVPSPDTFHEFTLNARYIPAAKIGSLAARGGQPLGLHTTPETTGSTLDAKSTRWNHTASSSAKLVDGATWKDHYVDGAGSGASGTVYTDAVSVGGVSMTSQAVQPATEASNPGAAGYFQFPVSGIIGFAFDKRNIVKPTKQKTFFSNIKSNLKKPVFTADLKHAAGDGTFGFGFIDTALYTGDITYTNVDSVTGSWTMNSTGYAIGTGDFVKTTVTGFVNTGSNVLTLPMDVYKAYTKAITGSTTDCTTKFPDFYFGLGSAKIKIAGEHLRDKQGTFCRLKVLDGGAKAIFGSPAMFSSLVIFEDDGKQPRIGWATSK
ncbi:hypothetical protein VHEMI07920 [[Torrubiella] hemipterigena]|uniref:Peptidase A1 domain-containing protein n=1 Tax=[Torrubiella] hemipterigena TaxID=1531966 RepID=A0A0A1TBW7_9HYPO|nr:hypothetical protein VHEMI07920 [[Torrubiella] hemipterigena]